MTISKKTLVLFSVILFILLFSLCFVFHSQQTATRANTSNNKTELIKSEYPLFANIFSIEGDFSDVKDDLLEAIEGRGLVISYTSHAKMMLDNTAEVAGVTKPVYNDAEILLFCKADLSHKLVAANPHNIVLCPYSISIYVIAAEPERVYLSFRKGEAAEEKTRAIDNLLVSILEEVVL